MTNTTPKTPPQRSRAARTTSVVVGVIVGLISLGLLALGGVLLWADSKKDDQGYISSHTQRFASSTSAIATENIDLDHAGPGWLTSHDHYGNVRLEVAPRNDKAVFVGIARTKDVSSYLRSTSHATLTDVDFDPFRATYRAERGASRPAAPASRRGHERGWLARRRHRRQRRRRLPDPRRTGVGLGRRRARPARRRLDAHRRRHHRTAPRAGPRARARLRRWRACRPPSDEASAPTPAPRRICTCAPAPPR
jgi:hypothetical protein